MSTIKQSAPFGAAAYCSIVLAATLVVATLMLIDSAAAAQPTLTDVIEKSATMFYLSLPNGSQGNASTGRDGGQLVKLLAFSEKYTGFGLFEKIHIRHPSFEDSV